MSTEISTWPRVRELLDGIMARWERKEAARVFPASIPTPGPLRKNSLTTNPMGSKFIEPGIPAEETALIISLRKGFGSIPRMPMGGPFLKPDEIDEIAAWIDAGMPE